MSNSKLDAWSLLINTLIVGVVFFLSFFYSRNVLAEIRDYLPFGIIIIFGGLLFEYRRISRGSGHILNILFGSIFLSFFMVLAFADKGIDKESLLLFLPYFYTISFVFLTLYYYKKDTVPKLTEGITLLQSLAIIYWFVDIGEIIDCILVYLVVIIGLVFSIFSIYHAFSYRKLTQNTKFLLSIWSSIIMIIFGFEYIIDVLKYYQLSISNETDEILIFTFQNFFLGISIIYIIQNFFLLIDYLAGDKDRILYQSEEEVKKEHIARFYGEQVNIRNSIIAFLLTIIYFSLNYTYNFIPKNMAIWSTFIFVPQIVSVIEVLKKRIKY